MTSDGATPRPGKGIDIEALGERWLAHLDTIEAMIAPIGEALMERVDVAPGASVLDIGCGGGDTCLTLARKVGPTGRVVGVDIAPKLIEAGQQRARDAGLTQVSFHAGDASQLDLGEARFDCLFSRFGVMFFADPPAAFAHLRSMLKPGGRALLCVWAPMEQNPWFLSIDEAISPHVDRPPYDPAAPGPFSMADQDRTRAVLEGAGFLDVAFELHRNVQLVGGRGAHADEAARFATTATQFADRLTDASPEVRERATADVRDALAAYDGPDGVRAPGAAWFVTARV